MRSSRALLPLLLALAIVGCATRPPVSDVAATQEYIENNDPVEPLNRFSYAVSDGVDTYFLAPVARAYRYAVPGAVRRPIHNVLKNLSTPVVFINDVIQAKPRRAGDTLMRFVINTTAGVGGLFDVASQVGYPVHNNDFGITLALWGIQDGPYLFLPLLGPSNPRDATGYGVDLLFDPLTYVPSGHFRRSGIGIASGVRIVDARERVLDQVASIKKTALDPYATFRSLGRQSRASAIEQVRTENRSTVPNWYSN